MKMTILKATSVCIWVGCVVYLFAPAMSRYYSDPIAWPSIVWLGIPTFVVWNARWLAGKIRLLTFQGPDREQTWVLVTLGFLLHAIQVVGLWLSRQNLEWMYEG